MIDVVKSLSKKDFTYLLTINSPITRVLILLCLIVNGSKLHATHIMGGDLTYVCTNAATRTYELTLTVYRDCDGTTLSSNQDLIYRSLSCGQSDVSIDFDYQGFENITPVCSPAVQTTCNSSSGTFPGAEKHTFTATVSLPMDCNDWEFRWEQCCRNNAITNLDLSNQSGFTITSLLNSVAAPCNNSPIFTTRPVSFLCQGVEFNFNHGAFDPDGDELRFSMIGPLTDEDNNNDNYNDPIDFIPPFTKDQPMDGDFSINPINGQLYMLPTSVQVFVSTVLVEEFRNGVKIGSVIRELQTIVLDNAFCGDVYLVGVRDVDGGTQEGDDSIFVCPNTDLTFNVLFLSAGGFDYQLNTNAPLVLPGSNTTSSVMDTLFFTVNWMPTVGDLGYHSVVFEIEYCTLDDIRVLQAFSVNIYVEADTTRAGPDRTLCSVSDPIRLDATGGSNFNWTPSTGIVGSTPNGSSIWVLPSLMNGQQICYTVTSDLDPGFCDNTDEVCITRDANASYAYGSNDTFLCGGYIIVDDVIVTSSGTFYDTIPRPGQCDSIHEYNVVYVSTAQVDFDTFFCGNNYIDLDGVGQVTNAGTYPVLLATQQGGCDSVVVYYVTRYLNQSSSQSLTICEGDSTMLPNGEYISTQGAHYDSLFTYQGCDSVITYNVSFYQNLASSVNASMCPGDSMQLPSGQYANSNGVFYDTLVSYLGCDSIVTFNITYFPAASLSLSVSGDTVCRNDAVTLTATTNGTSVTWFDGNMGLTNTVNVNSDTYYTAEATGGSTCITRDSILVEVVDPPIYPPTYGYCFGEYNAINLPSSEFENVWQTGEISDSLVITGATPDPLMVTSTYGDCINTSTIDLLQIYFDGVISVTPSDTVYVGTEVELSISSIGDAIENSVWETNNYFYNVEDNPVNFYLTSTYEFYAYLNSVNGCEDTTSILLVAIQDLYIPTAFSPNSDSHNDYFGPIGKPMEYFEMWIYSRWGELLFKSNALNSGWDGTYKGEPQEIDSYVYYIKAKVEGRPEKNYNGSFLLMR